MFGKQVEEGERVFILYREIEIYLNYSFLGKQKVETCKFRESLSFSVDLEATTGVQWRFVCMLFEHREKLFDRHFVF